MCNTNILKQRKDSLSKNLKEQTKFLKIIQSRIKSNFLCQEQKVIFNLHTLCIKGRIKPSHLKTGVKGFQQKPLLVPSQTSIPIVQLSPGIFIP